MIVCNCKPTSWIIIFIVWIKGFVPLLLRKLVLFSVISCTNFVALSYNQVNMKTNARKALFEEGWSNTTVVFRKEIMALGYDESISVHNTTTTADFN